MDDDDFVGRISREGIYTPPDVKAIEHDVQTMKAVGFNHEPKVSAERLKEIFGS